MSYRYMRIIIMFDLSVLTAKQRKEYTDFRKFLLKNGFMMMQESIYCKLMQNAVAGDTIIENIKRNKPSEGLVQVLRITEKQYSKIEYIVGKNESEVIDSDERLVII